MAMGMASAIFLLFLAIAILLPDPSRGGEWTVGDRIMLVLFGTAMAAMLWRWASIRALVTAEGLVIRNLMLTRNVGWEQIEHVRFPDGDPWVSLDLHDTDTVAVMAIQRADGDFGRQEAVRLATLVGVRQGERPGPAGEVGSD